jgi:hypothetical protein
VTTPKIRTGSSRRRDKRPAREVVAYIREWRRAYGLWLLFFDAPPPDPGMDRAALDLIERGAK